MIFKICYKRVDCASVSIPQNEWEKGSDIFRKEANALNKKNFLLLHVLDWDGWRDTKIKHNEKRERKLWKHQEQPAKESRFDEVRQRLKMVSLDYRRAPTSDRKRWMSPERELSRITWSRSHSEQNGSLDLSRSRFLESSCFRDKIFALWSSNKVESHARTVPSTCQFSCTLCTAIY